jgi:Flp pilus assembly protein TadD
VWWRAAAIAAVGLLAYANSFSGPFVFDDGASVVDNVSIRELFSARVLSPPREAPTAGRPLVNVAFAINYAFGGLSPSGYHAVNLTLHLLCAVVLFGVVRRTLALPRIPAALRARSIELAAGAALLWTLHPLNTEVVDYVTQRSESLMALCYLLTLYASVRATSTRATTAWNAVGLLACAAGMACKETMVTAPVAVWMYDRSFVFPSGIEALRRRWRWYLSLAATWIVLAALLWSGPRSYSAGFTAGVSVSTYLLNQVVMLARYAQLTVWPVPLVVAYGPPQALTAGEVMPTALFVIAAVVIAVVAWIRYPRAGFALVFAILTLAPTSSIVPIATEAGAERRMYLALAALISVLVVGAAAMVDRLRRPRLAAWIACGAVALSLGAVTFARNRDYRSSLVLAETVRDRWPTSFADALVGRQLAAAGRHDEAIAALRQAVAGYPPARYHLGGELFNQGALDGAIEQLQEFVRAQPWIAEAVPARTMIGRAHMLQRRYPPAVEQFREVVKMTPPGDAAHVTATGFLADSLFAQEQFQEAQAIYAQFLAARPSDTGALTNFAISLSALGRLQQAAAAFRRVVELNPQDEQARRNLQIALSDLAAAPSARGPR